MPDEEIRPLLAQAQQYVEAGLWDEAIIACYEALTVSPRHSDAGDLLLDIYTHPDLLNEIDHVIRREIRNMTPGSRRRRQALRLAYISFRPMMILDIPTEPPPNIAAYAGALDDLRDALARDLYEFDEDAREHADDLVRALRNRVGDAAVVDLLWYTAHQYAEVALFDAALEYARTVRSEEPHDYQHRLLYATLHWWDEYSHNFPWIDSP